MPDLAKNDAISLAGGSSLHPKPQIAKVAPASCIERPGLTLPAEEEQILKSELSQAKVFLEYGSGGSTIEALEAGVKTVFSVECDLAWARKIEAYVHDELKASNNFKIVAVDIGRTEKWAKPVDRSGWRSYIDYPKSVWARDDFIHPDLVLIDGRFRVACFAFCALFCQQPMRILFDDYNTRDNYHDCETVAKPSLLAGRMAVFDFNPEDLVTKQKEIIALLSYASDPR